MGAWLESCKYCPSDSFAKHCRKENGGLGRKKDGHRANKGYYGCARKCRYYEPEEIKNE